jgi:hypothetical protein
MNYQDQTLWDELGNFQIVNDTWTCVEKTFAIELRKNNLNHIKDTHHQIDVTNISRIQDMFIISAMNSCIDDQKSTFLFLSQVWDIDLTYVNLSGTNCLLSACLSNGNLSLIRYLINDLKMDPFHTDINQCNGLILACWNNVNLEMIKFLLELFDGKENQVDKWGDNCFLAACWNNKNPGIVKYLAQYGKVDTMIVNKTGDNCLLSACIGMGENLDVVKYLIEEMRMDPRYKNANGSNCLICANYHHISENGLKIIEYLINQTEVDLSLEFIRLETYRQILPRIRDYQKLNAMIGLGIKKYGGKEMNQVLDHWIESKS